VSISVYGDVSSKPTVDLNEKEVSTMVGFAIGGVRMFESGWDTLRRREIGLMTGEVGKYAQWIRVDACVTVGRVSMRLCEHHKATGVEEELVKFLVRDVEAACVVRSLDATATASVAAVELEDRVQIFGDEYKYILCSTVPDSGRGHEALVTGRVHVWNSKSPHRDGLDVYLESTLSQLKLGSNLETLGLVQNCIAEALEAGIMRAKLLAQQEGRDSEEVGIGSVVQAPMSVPSNPMQMAASALSAAGSVVVHSGTNASEYTQVGSRLALKFVGTMHAVDIALYTSRRSAVFPVALLSVRGCDMTNEETRNGRIEINASVGALTVTDLTPSAATIWQEPLALTNEMGPDQPPLSTGKIASCRYIHYSRRERQDEDAKLQVAVGRIDLVAGPRFISEVVAYIYKSSVFRSNFAALWAASSVASSRVKFRKRVDATAMSYRYKLLMEVSVGGLKIVCPESSSSHDCFRLLLPPMQVLNQFSDTSETLGVDTTVRLSSHIKGVEQDLVSFDFNLWMDRRLSLAHSSQEVPVMDLDVRVGAISIDVSQPQVALIWRSAFAHVAEVKAAWSWQYQGAATSKSVLEIAAIRKLLDGAFEAAAEKERVRQAASDRADEHLLDMRVCIAFAALNLSMLGKPTGDEKVAAIACLDIFDVSANMMVWSDTAWQSALSVSEITVRDVAINSTNCFKELIAPSWPPDHEIGMLPFLQAHYHESATGDGDLKASCVGLTVLVSVEPIFNVLSTVFNAFESQDDTALTSAERMFEPPKIKGEKDKSVAPQQAADAYSWWGGSVMRGSFELGLCEVSLIQDCTDLKSSRLVLSLSADGMYQATRDKEEGKLEVHDATLYTEVPEISEPLNILEKTPVVCTVRKNYCEKGVVTTFASVLRSVDIVVTYQDTKRIYGLVKVVQDAAKKSGFNSSTGYSYFSSLMERDDDPAFDAAVAGGQMLAENAVETMTKVDVRIDIMSFCMINDCMGWTVPFATFCAKNSLFSFEVRPDESASLNCQTTLDCSFYNVMNTCFEPLVEPWTVKLEALETPGRATASIAFSADSKLEVNISEMHMRSLVQTVEGWLQDSKTWGKDRDVTQEKFSPYRLRNESGVPLTFWLGSSFEPPEDQSMTKDLASGGEEPFEFSQKRALQVRQRDMNIEFHTLSIKFDNIEDVLTHVPVDIIGVHMLPLGDLRAVAEIHNDSGCKIIAIQSTFKVYNKTSLSVDACICDPEDGSQNNEAWEKALPWQETFAGECHGCVPLYLSNTPCMSVRPTGGKFHFSSPIPVPKVPVTGESVFVCCPPVEGSGETQSTYFRVRLDAKKPVGGHEDNMRIVISIHPALRVQNALPFQMQTSIYSVPAGGAGVKVAECSVGEGSVEQLYCADLKTNLRMTAFLSTFTKVSKPVLVHDADGGSVDKTIDLLDEAGGMLRLGMETTSSAWGDLTIVIYAQYLIRNFTQLPLIYGASGRVNKPAAGQNARLLTMGSTPDKPAPPSPTKQSPSDRHSDSVFQAIYAVFGPRSAFHGTAVMCDPPLADGEITNADQIRGNVALVRRGVIPFTEKARKVSKAGAIGVIFINTDDTTFLAEGDKGPGIRLPSVMLTKTEGEILARSAKSSALKVHVTPESASRTQRATSQLLEWKRVVKAAVRVEDAGVLGGSPEKQPGVGVAEALWGSAEGNRGDNKKASKEIAFPDSWMELPGDAPLMFSYESEDLTGNKSSFCLPGSEWAPAFSLESMGTTGVVAVPGCASELPSLKGVLCRHFSLVLI